MVENSSKIHKGGVSNMDQLYTVDEMISLFKVSRGTLYNYMNSGILPYVELPGGRRFIGSQVMKALKDMQTRQNVEKTRDFASVSKDTLSDASRKLKAVRSISSKALRKTTTSNDKIRVSKFVKRTRAV